MFCGVRGNPIASNYCGKLLRRELDRIGLPQVHVHGLRHTAATFLVSMGVPLKNIARMLGHRNEMITLRIYTHTLPGVEEEAVERMAALLRGS